MQACMHTQRERERERERERDKERERERTRKRMRTHTVTHTSRNEQACIGKRRKSTRKNGYIRGEGEEEEDL